MEEVDEPGGGECIPKPGTEPRNTGYCPSAAGAHLPSVWTPDACSGVEPCLVQTKGEMRFQGKMDQPYLFWGLSRQQILAFLGMLYQLHLQRPGSGKSITTIITNKQKKIQNVVIHHKKKSKFRIRQPRTSLTVP